MKDEKRLAETCRRRDVVGSETDVSASLALYHRLLPELASVPQMFMSLGFSLQDPSTFAKVFLSPGYPDSANPFQESGLGDEDSGNPFQVLFHSSLFKLIGSI